MREPVSCAECGAGVSRAALECLSCGHELNAVPKAIVADVIHDLGDDELIDFLFRYSHAVLSDRGCFADNGPSERDILASLPRGVRLAGTMVRLDSEVHNGGFYQWFTNSSGESADLAVDDLRLIGASAHVALVEEAIALDQRVGERHPHYARRWDLSAPEPDQKTQTAFWSDVKAKFYPEYDRLSSAYYDLQETDSLWPKFIAWVRQHPDQCVHSR